MLIGAVGGGEALAQPRQGSQRGPVVQRLRVLLLSTMLADRGIGEWGFAALVDADGRRLLFDTGAAPDTVLRNARSLGVDLGGVEDVILSHNHRDHTGGLLALRRALRGAAPRALSRVHVAPGIFYPRPGSEGDENGLLRDRAAFTDSLKVWRTSLGAGFLGAFASACWFAAFALTPAANVRTLGLIEMPLAALFAGRLTGKTTSGHELAGLGDAAAGRADPDLTRHHRGGRPGA